MEASAPGGRHWRGAWGSAIPPPTCPRAHPRRAAYRRAHSLKAIPSRPRPPVPPKCRSSWQKRGPQRGQEVGREEAMGCREIQKPFPTGKPHLPALRWAWGWGPSPAPSPLQNGQGDRDQDAGRPRGAWATTDTDPQTQTDEGHQVKAAGQKPSLTRHPSLGSWPGPRPRRAGSRRLARLG